MKQPANVISTVGLTTLGTVNCAAGLNASHMLSPLVAGKRDGEKGGVVNFKATQGGCQAVHLQS